MMNDFEAIAMALQYPGPGRLEELRESWESLPGGPVRRHLLKFLGEIEKLSPADSDAYFATRSRASQLGAWASRQSEPMQSRFSLLRRFALLEARWLGRPD